MALDRCLQLQTMIDLRLPDDKWDFLMRGVNLLIKQTGATKQPDIVEHLSSLKKKSDHKKHQAERQRSRPGKKSLWERLEEETSDDEKRPPRAKRDRPDEPSRAASAPKAEFPINARVVSKREGFPDQEGVVTGTKMSGEQQVYIVRVGEESYEVTWEILLGMLPPPAPVVRPPEHVLTPNPRARSRARYADDDGPPTLDYRDRDHKMADESSLNDWMKEAAATRMSDSI